MRRTKTNTDETVVKTKKTYCPPVCDQAPRITEQESKYPIGYARPDEKEVWLRYQQNLKRLPETIANMTKSQEEAARNGLTEEILEKLLAKDAA